MVGHAKPVLPPDSVAVPKLFICSEPDIAPFRSMMEPVGAAEATMRTFTDHTIWMANIIGRAMRAYRRRRIERVALAQLWSMTDYQLRDIGLKRAEIDAAPKGKFTQLSYSRNFP